VPGAVQQGHVRGDLNLAKGPLNGDAGRFFLRNFRLVNYGCGIVALNPITQKAQQFIAQYIQSIEQLEIFLTLGNGGDRSWSVEEVFRKIQSNEKSISDCLRYFVKEGLAVLEKEDQYRISRESPNLVAIASELQKAYRERQVTIIEMIYKKPPSQIQNFADAFRLRKDK
jgi:GTP-binding protein EngB required for normal cell division